MSLKKRQAESQLTKEDLERNEKGDKVDFKLSEQSADLFVIGVWEEFRRTRGDRAH